MPKRSREITDQLTEARVKQLIKAQVRKLGLGTSPTAPVSTQSSTTELPGMLAVQRFNPSEPHRRFTDIGPAWVGDGRQTATRSWVKHLVTPVSWVPDSVTVPFGTTDAGNVASLQTRDDADTLDISEAGGATPNLRVLPVWQLAPWDPTEIPTMLQIVCNYDGNHDIHVEVYDQVGADWEEVGEIAETSGLVNHKFDLFDGAKYVKSDGQVEVRLDHDEVGNPSDDLIIDYMALWHVPYEGGGGGITDHSQLSGLDHADHPLYELLTDYQKVRRFSEACVGITHIPTPETGGSGSGIADEMAQQWVGATESAGVMQRYRSKHADRTIGRDLHEDVRRFAL